MMKFRFSMYDQLNHMKGIWKTHDFFKPILPTQFDANQKLLNFRMKNIGQSNTFIETKLKLM
jgi:hypothetical protein